MEPKITRIRARRLVSGPGYSNRSVEAEAEVGDGDPERALRALESWIGDQLALPNLPRDFTPSDAETMADGVRDLIATAERSRERLALLIGEHTCVAYSYGARFGRQCRFCCAPMPDAGESGAVVDAELPF